MTLVHIPRGIATWGRNAYEQGTKKNIFFVAVVFLKFSLFLILFILALSQIQILKLQNFTGTGSGRAGLSESFLSFFLKG